jgi:succinoglycan biosynthesis protein ExoA
MRGSSVAVSVLVPLLNEAAVICETMDAMSAQRFNGGVEFLLLDGGSSDGTREIVAERARRDPSFKLFDNPSRRVASALNLGLNRARGEFVARMDAHTRYPPDYLRTGVERLRRGDVDWVSGPQIATGQGGWSSAVALALSLPLGVGGAQFRYPLDREIETDTGFTGIVRRSTLEALGGWDEEWLVNEDGELAARVRERGGRIVCVPEMAAEYYPRASLGGLARQYWTYGQFRAKTSRRHPESMRPSHLLPPALTLAGPAALIPWRWRRLARALLGVYALALLAQGVRRFASGDGEIAPRLPVVLATMHSAWGAGFLAGCARFGPPVRATLGALGRAMSTAAKRRMGRD